MFGRQIDDDQAIGTRFFGIGDEGFNAINVNWIEIAHQHDGSFFVGLAEFTHQLQRLLHVLAVGQGTKRGGLDGRAVGHGVGKWHANFDDIRTGFGQALQDRQGCIKIRVACCDEGDEGGAALLFQRGKARVDAGCHSFTPRCSATVKMSLSPRPHIFITIR